MSDTTHAKMEESDRLISKARGWSDRDLHKYPSATLELIAKLTEELEQAQTQLSAIDADMDGILGNRKEDDATSVLARTADALREEGERREKQGYERGIGNVCTAATLPFPDAVDAGQHGDWVVNKIGERVRREALEEAAKVGHRSAFEFLGMRKTQRTYSWHDVEDALIEGSAAIRALAAQKEAKE